MKRILACLLILALLIPNAACEENLTEEIPAQLIHDVLLTTVGETFGEFGVVGWEVLGQETSGRERRLYLAASVGRYGLMGGACTLFSGWGGPCTVVLQRVNGEWAFKELLEIEDFTQISDIMPRSMEKKFLSGDYDEDGVNRMLNAEIEAHLQELDGGAYRLKDYADVSGDMPHMYAWVSAILPYFMDLLGCTTVEQVEDGVRVICSKTWVPDDPNDQGEHQTVLKNDITYIWSGTSGTLTYTKTRKDDGAVLQSIVIRAAQDEVEIRMKDGYGSIRYLLPVIQDENGFPTCAQPSVTCEGACRIDTEVLECYLADLPGERQSTWHIEAQALVSETERFTLLRDSCFRRLCHEVLTEDGWQTDWENDRMIQNHCADMAMTYQSGPVSEQTPRYSRTLPNELLLYSLESDHPKVRISLSRGDDGSWQVNAYRNEFYGESAVFLSDCTLFPYAERPFYAPAVIHENAAHFDPAVFRNDFWKRYDASDFDLIARKRYADLGFMGDYAVTAGAEALYADLGISKTVPVFAFPSKNAYRAANGKAAVSLNDTVAFLCRDGDCLMILYEMGENRHRTGWIDTAADPALEKIAPYVMAADFGTRNATTTQKAALYDDPINMDGVLCTLQSGTKVTVLSDSAPLYYVEADVDGKAYRGYMEKSCLSE